MDTRKGQHQNASYETLIRLSREYDEIVTATYTEGLAVELLAACEANADVGGSEEFWGEDWRVHLVISPKKGK